MPREILKPGKELINVHFSARLIPGVAGITIGTTQVAAAEPDKVQGSPTRPDYLSME